MVAVARTAEEAAADRSVARDEPDSRDLMTSREAGGGECVWPAGGVAEQRHLCTAMQNSGGGGGSIIGKACPHRRHTRLS